MRFTSTFRNLQSGESRFPKLKRSQGQRFQADAGRGTTIIEGQRINKIGWVRLCQALRHLGTVVKVVISKTANPGSLLSPLILLPMIDNRDKPVVGIDVGIKHLAVTSEGVYHENPKALKRYERKLKRLQRQLSRRKKGSSNWHKTQSKIAKLHYRITCIRQDAQHQAKRPSMCESYWD